MITLGLSRAVDFITISMCFFAIGWCQRESPGSGHGSCLNRRKEAGGVSHPEMWVCQTHEPGRGSQDHVNVASGTRIFTCQLATVEAVSAVVPCSFFSPAPRLGHWTQIPVKAAFTASKLALSQMSKTPFQIYPGDGSVLSA